MAERLISTYLLHFILVQRLLLNKFFTYGDDFRLHIYIHVWKQFNNRVIKADDSVKLVCVLIILQFIFGFSFFFLCFPFTLYILLFEAPLDFTLIVLV